MHNLIAHALIGNGNGEFLIMKRSMQRGGKRNFEGGKWDIPGGKVEAFETPQEAAIRETEEEIGLNVRVKGVIFESSNFDTEKNQVFTTLVYLCDSENNGRMKLNLEEHDEYKWSAPEDILDMKEEELVPYMKGMILAFKRMKDK